MVKVIDEIKQKIIDFEKEKASKKVLLAFSKYTQMVKEESLTSGFCTKHQIFLGHDNYYCFKCKSNDYTVKRELPFIEIFGLPFEITSNVKEITII